MPRVFISYSRQDKPFAQRLAADLERLGGDVFLDVDDIHPAEDWSDVIHRALNDCQIMLVIITPASMESKNVSQEWKYFNSRNKVILPVLLEPADIHFQLANLQHVDFSSLSHEAAFAQIHAALQRQGMSLAPLSSGETSVQTPAWRISRVPAILPPPFEWIEIPVGQVTLITEWGWDQNYIPAGQQQLFEVPAFAIAKYPITNAQYAKFIEADGYREQKWWTATGWQQCEQNGWKEPRFWDNSDFNGAEQPVVGVSWYEAIAFCHWLSGVSGETVTLPTEQQWQRAAQGDDGREYPWGNEPPNERLCNYYEREGRTTPVTKYPAGASPYGVMDMAGNVWEWCLTARETGSVNVDDDVRRVVRGGAWDLNLLIALAVVRNWCEPIDGFFNIGFRVMCASLI